MKTVRILQAFTLTKNDGTTQQFAPGIYELEDDIANHFYVKVHSDKAPYIEPVPGTPEAAQLAARRNARRRILDAAIEESAAEDIEHSRDEQNEVVRRRIVTNALTPPVHKAS